MCLGGNWNGVFCDTIPLQSSNSHAVHLVGFKHLATVTRFKCSPSSPPPLDDSFDPASSVTISLSQLNLAKFILSNFICFDWKIIFYFCTSQACGGKSRALYIYIHIWQLQWLLSVALEPDITSLIMVQTSSGWSILENPHPTRNKPNFEHKWLELAGMLWHLLQS